MRNVSAVLKRKLAANVQAGDNALAASLWVGRPTTPLIDNNFLEKQTILSSNAISKTSIAVCHPKIMQNATEISVAYIENGIAKVTKSKYNIQMKNHIWLDEGFSQEAEDISICYDGTMRKAINGTVELITDNSPWVFWVLNGSLFGQILGEENIVVLAETQCHAVSAIRAMWSLSGSFDFGLIVFFLLNGSLFYRQLVDGEWKDAEPVTFGPKDILWEDIVAFRTWDYRVGIQAKASDGKIYELFTQYMGIAKQGEEHISVDTDANVDMIKITHHNHTNEHHLSITDITTGAPYGGFYEVESPHFVSAENIPDENGDWGKLIKVVMSNHMRENGVANNASSFVLTDETGLSVAALEASLNIDDGLTIIIRFADFNAMKGMCSISYNPGDATNMADTLLEYTEFSFMPINLVQPNIPVPEVEEIWNLDPNGNNIAIKFTEPLVGNRIGNENAFTVTFNEYDMVPEGSLIETSRKGTGTKVYSTVHETVDVSSGNGVNVIASKLGISLGVDT